MGTLNSVLASERKNLESRQLLVGKPGVLGYLPGLPTGDMGNAGKDPRIKPRVALEAVSAGGKPARRPLAGGRGW